MRVLIVEDDAAMARGLAERLKLAGFAVDIESDGASAAQTALLEPYSLIILDINLPNASGFEVLHRIRRAGSTVPVMILQRAMLSTTRSVGSISVLTIISPSLLTFPNLMLVSARL